MPTQGRQPPAGESSSDACAGEQDVDPHESMRTCMLGSVCMPKTVQIRDLDDDVYAALTRRAAEAGVSVPELLRADATRLAARPTLETWLARTRRRSASVSRADVLAALDDQRGPWPDAGR
jgi:plasmid stability protein